jgi:N-carbamoyl-L-amino-acid hydrolase
LLQQFNDTLYEMIAESDAAGPCRAAVEQLSRAEPKVMSAPLIDALHESALALAGGNRVIRMPSGAGHDAQIINQIIPSAMLFVPSIGGISHHIDEDTAEEDIVLGCEVMAAAADRILKR